MELQTQHTTPTKQSPMAMGSKRVQRQYPCACGGASGHARTCETCRQQQVQRQATSASSLVTAPPIVQDALRSTGQPLDPATRAFMEPRFGHDFSQVRIHADAHAAQSARAINALAYTVGHDVVFAAGRYAPHTREGQRLLAHELTHVLQQQPRIARQAGIIPGPPLDTRGSNWERVIGREPRLPPRQPHPPTISPPPQIAQEAPPQNCPDVATVRTQLGQSTVADRVAAQMRTAILIGQARSAGQTIQFNHAMIQQTDRAIRQEFGGQLPSGRNFADAQSVTVRTPDDLAATRIPDAVAAQRALGGIALEAASDTLRDLCITTPMHPQLQSEIAAPLFTRLGLTFVRDHEKTRIGGQTTFPTVGGVVQPHVDIPSASRNLGHIIVHEAMHFYVNPTYQSTAEAGSLRQPLMEGGAEFLARHVIRQRLANLPEFQINDSTYADYFSYVAQYLLRGGLSSFALAYFQGRVDVLGLTPVQPKLEVSQPGDADEQEADRVADHVLSLPASHTEALPIVPRSTATYRPTVLQRHPAGPPQLRVRTFAELWEEFTTHRAHWREAEALALVPDLIVHMSGEDAVQHAVDLAFWLMDRGEWSLARDALSELEMGWWLRYISEAGPGLPRGFGISDPRNLVERAKTEARAGRNEQAFRLFGLAFLFAQMELHEASVQREARLADTEQRLLEMGDEGVQVAGTITAFTRIITYSDLGAVIGLMREILGFYPSLEREAIAAGDQDRARQASGMGLLLRIELRDHYTLSTTRGITMESSRTTTPTGAPGYTIHGAQGETEIVTPLPGTRTPEELGMFPSYTSTMEELQEALAGQEEFITSLYSYPEIRAEFGTRRINMSSLDDRLRVWRTMYRIYQREDTFGFGALGSLLRLIERYLRHFTRHTEYNIRDYGVSYLSTDLPEDLAGRAVRDCGVYALTVAYEVYRTARAATPRLPVDFRLYATPEHVMLAIFDRQQDNHYIVNNDRITGPSREDVMTDLARAYAQTFSRQYAITPAASVELGSTGMSDTAFRTSAWRQYQLGSQWGLRPESRTGPDDPRSEGERGEAIYRRYYQDLQRFDTGAARLDAGLSTLVRDLAAAANAADRQRLLAERMPDLSQLGLALAIIFDTFGPHAQINAGSEAARRALGGRALYLYAHPSGDHPLARIGMALLHVERLGTTLSLEQQQIITWLRTIPAFRASLERYEAAGRPATF